jgi:UDP-N-acetylmuramoyl-L-alanyl-D-glutamate--2,6-diaminopimelate ligase
MEKLLCSIKKIIPQSVYQRCQPIYHHSLALASAVMYGFPSRRIKVIAVTGTKGKSSTVEIINAILEEAGYKTALSNTIHFKIGDNLRPNLFKMSMPGRGFIQRFLRDAVHAGCDYAVIEMTSQGAAQYRHAFINIDVFVVTNISPEHIESHSSYEKYVEAKLAIGRQFETSQKKSAKNGGKNGKKDNNNVENMEKVLIINKDDPALKKFTELKADKKIEYSITETKPYTLLKNDGEDSHGNGLEFTYHGQKMTSHLSGLFNLYNILAAIKTAESQNVPIEKIKSAIQKFTGIKGRVERIVAGQDFTVIVDYAHTADSLEKLYQVFRPDPRAARPHKLIGVLGGTGGGRDRAKRKEMGKLATRYCDYVVLTNEDPYDEDPMTIINDVKTGTQGAQGAQGTQEATIILDRRLAIRDAIAHAKSSDIILITGKGTDPFIMGAKGNNIQWSDAKVAREELENVKK